MSILDEIKKEAAAGVRTKIQTTAERDIETKLNNLFYLEKDIENEIKFLRSVMTRGQETAERKGLHASAVIVSDEKFCYRQQVLSLFYKQKQGEQISPGLRRIFAEGDAIHEKWQRLFIRAGYADYTGCDVTRYDNRYDLQYTPDIMAEIDGTKYVVEIKSVNTMSYKNMEKQNKPHPSGKKQLHLYMFLTGVHNGIVLCEDKNTQEFRANLYEYEEKEIRKYIKRLNQIQVYKNNLTENRKLVKRHEKCVSYGCKMAESCPMREVCYGMDKSRL